MLSWILIMAFLILPMVLGEQEERATETRQLRDDLEHERWLRQQGW